METATQPPFVSNPNIFNTENLRITEDLFVESVVKANLTHEDATSIREEFENAIVALLESGFEDDDPEMDILLARIQFRMEEFSLLKLAA